MMRWSASTSLCLCPGSTQARSPSARRAALTLLRVRQQRLQIQHEMPHPLRHPSRSDQERLVLPLLLDLVHALPGGRDIVLRGLSFALALSALGDVVGCLQHARHGGDGGDVDIKDEKVEGEYTSVTVSQWWT
jgi:hypothetical protein